MKYNQLDIEKQNRETMFVNTMSKFNDDIVDNSVSNTNGINKIIMHYSDELTKELNEYKKSIAEGEAKREPISYKILSLIDVNIVAFYTVKTIINFMGNKDIKVNTIAHSVAKVLETEYKLSQIAESNSDNAEVIQKYITNTKHKGLRKVQVIRDLIKKYYKDVNHDLNINMVKLSMLCIQMATEIQPEVNGQVLPLLATIYKEEKKHGANLLVVLPWVKEFILDGFDNGTLLNNYNTCMVDKPIDWVNVRTKGGYHSDFFKYPLVKTSVSKKKFDGCDISKTLNAVNTLQRTAWRVNASILDVMRDCIKHNNQWGGLPYCVSLDKIPYPFEGTIYKTLSEDKKEIVKKWRKDTAKKYSEKVSEDSKFMSLFRALSEAERFKNYEALYFPYFLDFRGRAYPVSSNLNPQGTEYIKSLLEFSEGKSIDTKEAELMFFSEGATRFGQGNDKKSLIDKHKWIKGNHNKIIDSANNPTGDTFWKQADESPWLFLAFCFEYRDYIEYGTNFKSRMVVSMDGSCNGLQHLSAMLFDEIGGKSVNITNNLSKQDIYTDVLTVVINKLNVINTDISKSLLSLGMDRSITKRPVMIVPYAGTRNACREYIDIELKKKNGETLLGDNYIEALNLLTNIVWESIGEVIIKGREIMDFLSKFARVVVKQDGGKITIEWTTPNGFKVVQKCVKWTQVQLKSKLGDIILRGTHQKESTKTDTRHHGFGIAPNFIHSLDACHLQNTVNSLGEISYAMVHDSFGTHANTAWSMYKALRTEFYNIYKDGDVLTNFIRQQNLDEELYRDLIVPIKGDLTLAEVLDSEYFFI